MMPLIERLLLTAGSSPAASLIIKITLAAVLALGAGWLARRSRASVRHAILVAGFVVLLLLPAVSLFAPAVRIAVPPTPTRGAPLARVFGSTPRLAPSSSHAEAATAPVPSIAVLVGAAWATGTALFLLPVIVGLWQVRRLRHSARAWPRGEDIALRLLREAGVSRRVSVLLHPTLAGPMACGLFHPAIVLCEDAQTWGGDDLERAIIHELAHVRRGDWASHALTRAVCSLYWFHPLVWMAWRRLALEAERASDDAVLERSEATAYADQLVGLARRLSRAPLPAMANRADLGARVAAVLDAKRRRGPAGTLPVALACAAAALVLALAPLRVVAAPQSVGAPGPFGNFANATELVQVDVGVKDASGQPVEGLRAGDFTITEDGVPQSIVLFEFQKLVSDPPDSGVPAYYILGYYSRNQYADGQFHRIHVTGKQPAMVQLDYRPGYYASKGLATIAPPGQEIPLGISAPVLLYKVGPEYSEQARKSKYQGSVGLNLQVDETGRVTGASVVRSLGLGLDEKAIEAVKKWRFKPAMQNLRPIAAETQVELSFWLP